MVEAEQSHLHCPLCGSKRLYRDGLRYLKNGASVQRWLCRNCNFRFAEDSQLKKKYQYLENVEIIDTKILRLQPPTSNCRERNERNSSRKEHGSPVQMKHIGSGRAGVLQTTEDGNLARVETRQEKAAGATEDFKSKVVEFLWHLKKQGRAESTIENHAKFLNYLLRKHVYDPESVKDFIASQENWSNGTKTLYVTVYKNFTSWFRINWNPPKYAVAEKLPFIPTEQEIDQLIAGCGNRMSALLQLLKETGVRKGEAIRLTWTDIDFERRLVTITAEKGSRSRMLPISNKLIEMLKNLPKKSTRIFQRNPSGNFHIQRLRMAKKLGNPRLIKIHFHTLRHWKGTTEYHKTKDIIHVMGVLGHKRIENTMLYIHLEQALFQTTNEDFHVRIAKSPEEIKSLLEIGFEYICDKDGLMFFRKRK